MFQCPFKQCVRNFTRRAALREHLKTHDGEAYWEKLDNISSDRKPEYNLANKVNDDEIIAIEKEEEYIAELVRYHK
jgi:hypothetical protein